MDAELRDHIERYADDLIARGLSPEDAYRRARVEFGAVESVKDACRDSKGLDWTDGLARNFRYAVRVLRKNPAFALTAVLALALCIGANTAIFSVVDAVLFRPLPYPQPDRLGRIVTLFHGLQGDNEDTSTNGRRWEYLRDRVRTLDVALHALPQGVNLAGPNGAEYIQQLRVSAGFFRVLGVNPLLGREIAPEEDRFGGPPVAVISNALWKRMYHSDPAVVGGKIILRGEPYTVIGIMPEGFNTMPPVEVWTPLRPSTRGEGSGSNYGLIARTQPGYDWNHANAELSSLGSSFVSDNNIKLQAGSFIRFSLMSMQRAMADDARVPLSHPLVILWAAVGLILLIGCVNVAGLILSRGRSRRHEIATRLALGSGRRAILLQLLAESLLLAVAGGIAGLALGYLALSELRVIVSRSLALAQPMTIDLRVLAMTAAIAFVSTILFGLYPAWDATRLDIRTGLAGAGRTASMHRDAWTRRGIVMCEVALGMVLLVTAGLMLRTLSYFAALSPGYDARNVLTASLSLQDARYSTADKVNHLFDETLALIRQYPGVQAAGVGLTLPYERALNDGARVLDGPATTSNNRETSVTYVTPGYFEALRMRLVAGRFFEDRDQWNSPRVAIVNEAFVRRFFQNDSPLGRHLSTNGSAEIIGVIHDVPQLGFSDPIAYIPDVYVPASQMNDGFFQLVHTWFSPSWIVRSTGTPVQLQALLAGAVASVDPQLPFAKFRTMDEIRATSFALQRLESMLLSALAALALLLTAVGVYGLIANSVAERTREFGIRIALGSTTMRAIGIAVRPGIVLAAIGIGIGYLLSRWSSNLLKAIVYGVQLTDPPTYLVVGSVLLGAAALASFIPTLRIARIDPARTLREE